MKVKSKIFIILLSLFLMFSLSTAVATEDITFEQINLTITDENIEINHEDEKLKQFDELNPLSGSENHVQGNDFTDIQQEIDDAQDGDTIFLDGKYYTGNLSISVDKQLTIVGGSSLNDSSYAILDAQHCSGIMNVHADNVVIKGIKFINGKGMSEGTVGWFGDVGNLINCSFVDNRADYGGAIWWESYNGNITNCSFTNNSAIFNAGAIHMAYWGEGRYCINNCSFIGNKADYGGAIYLRGRSSRITNSTFINNSANTTAGAVSLAADGCLVDGNEFINNSANHTAGAIRIYYIGNALINNTFQNNNGDDDGSIIWVEGENHSLIGNFINNTNNDIAIFVDWFRNITLENNTFAKDDNQLAGQIWVMDVYGDHEGYIGRPSSILVHFHDLLGKPAEGFILISEDLHGTVARDILIDGKAFFNIILPDNSSNLNLKIIHTSLENPNVTSMISTFNINVLSNWANAISNISQIEDKVFVKCAFDATGMIVMDINGIKYSADIHNASAIFDIGNLANGEYVANLIYSGDYKYSPEEQFVKITVTNHSTFAVIEVDDNLTGFIGNNIPVQVFVHDDLGNPLTGEITLFGYATQKLVNGSAIFNVKLLDAGTMTLVLGYGMTIKNFQIIVRDDSIKNITQVDNIVIVNLQDGATGTVTIFINDKNYTALVNNSKAIVEIDNLDNGNYAASVIYFGDYKYPHDEKVIILSVKKPKIDVPVYRISENRDVSVIYSGKAAYRVLVTRDGKAVSGQIVTFNFNGKNIIVKTDAGGYATLNINTNVKLGTYAIKATFNDVSVTNKVKINQLIKASDKKVKKSSKLTKVKITLKKVDGKFLKSKKLTIKFNGKKYKVKTNNKGVGTWKVKKSMLKKLKVGKKVKYTVTYGKATLTKKLTIRR